MSKITELIEESSGKRENKSQYTIVDSEEEMLSELNEGSYELVRELNSRK